MVPKEDLLPVACKLDMPCFTIIEEPLIKKRRIKDKPSSMSQQNKDNGTEITSKIMRMSVMNLMWNVTETSLKFLNKKIPKSGATNIRKFRGLPNEKLNSPSRKVSPRLEEDPINKE